jgi:hypothetical protein
MQFLGAAGPFGINRHRQRRGVRLDPLRDTILRVVGAAETIGVRAMLVRAISDEALISMSAGLRMWPVDPMTLMITIDEAGHTLEPPNR